jgi:hypothetical protein
MRTRRVLSLTVVSVLVILAGTTALHAAIDQYRSRPLDRQNVGHIVGPRKTQSTDWAQIGGWSFSDGMVIQARGAIAATLSVTVSGAPVDFRIVMELPQKHYAQRLMKPAFANFDPQGGTASFSFTYVAAVAPGPYTINLLWRSPTGVETTLTGGSLVVQYGSSQGS